MNPANTLTPEAELFQVGKALGMGRDAIEKEIRSCNKDRRATADLLRRWKLKWRRVNQRLEREQEARWFADQREQADQRHAIYRAEGEADRQREREAKPLDVRLGDVMRGLTVMASASAGQIAYQSPSSERADVMPVDVPAEEYAQRVLLLVRAMEQELDRLRFGGADSRESTDQRNKRLIEQYEGVPSEAVSFIEPRMGHAVSIERTRRQHGRRGRDGTVELREAA